MKRWLVLGLGASAGGYANIEHYFNSTDPRGGTQDFFKDNFGRGQRAKVVTNGILRVAGLGREQVLPLKF